MKLTNVRAAPAPVASEPITDPAVIRAALEALDPPVHILPSLDGLWEAEVVIDETGNDGVAYPRPHTLMAFAGSVKSVHKGTMQAGRPVSIVNSKLVVK